jgi:hypothetical protein
MVSLLDRASSAKGHAARGGFRAALPFGSPRAKISCAFSEGATFLSGARFSPVLTGGVFLYAGRL